MSFRIKICGLTTPATLSAALEAGADMVGLVFHPRSPRVITPDAATALATQARGRAEIVALVVDADDAALDDIITRVQPDWLQLHGQETPQRVTELRARHGVRVMKVIGIARPDDLAGIARYRDICDLVMLDAKPPKDAAFPGGHGIAFDWALLEPLAATVTPLVLAGGLTPENVAGAIAQARGWRIPLAGVDVSSGVERAPGVKDVAKIKAFVAAARRVGQSARQDG